MPGGTGKHCLAYVGKEKCLQETRCRPRDVRSGTVDKHDLALVLQPPQIRRTGSGKGQLQALRTEQGRDDPRPDRRNGCPPFVCKVTAEVSLDILILETFKQPPTEWF